MRRRAIVPVLAALAIALSAGCSSGGDDAPTAAPTASFPDSSTTSSPTSEAPTSEAPSTTDAASPTATDEPDDPEAGATTAIEHIWIDDSWSVDDSQADYDHCAQGGAYASPWSDQEGYFICGSNAAGLKACRITPGSEEVLCIVDGLDKTAARFTSPTAAETADGPLDEEQPPIPLYVALADGAVCAPITRDHDQHFGGMFSWYRCDDGSELLTADEIDATFEKEDGGIWTAQRSVDKGAPEQVRVARAVFAGE